MHIIFKAYVLAAQSAVYDISGSDVLTLKSAKMHLLAFPVSLFICNNSRTAEQISLKFNVGVQLVSVIHFWQKMENCNMHFFAVLEHNLIYLNLSVKYF